jgi:hypothetical protein
MKSWLIHVLHTPFYFTGPDIFLKNFLSHIANLCACVRSNFNFRH